MPIGLDEPYRVYISEDPLGFDGGSTNLSVYAANNPLLLIDPEGLWTFQIGVSTTGGAGGGATYGRGIVFGHSEENGWQFGTYDTGGAGAYGGVSGGASIDVSWSGNTDINKLTGVGSTVGGSAKMPVVGIEVGGNVEMSRGSKPSYSVSVGVGGGLTPVEMHGFITHTKIKECCK